MERRRRCLNYSVVYMQILRYDVLVCVCAHTHTHTHMSMHMSIESVVM